MATATVRKLIARIRLLRESKRLSQEAFAELSGISYKYYQALEGGRKQELRLSTVERLAKAHGLEAWELIAPEVPKSRLKASTNRPGKKGKSEGKRKPLRA